MKLCILVDYVNLNESSGTVRGPHKEMARSYKLCPFLPTFMQHVSSMKYVAG
jgi:hypothetical protein